MHQVSVSSSPPPYACEPVMPRRPSSPRRRCSPQSNSDRSSIRFARGAISSRASLRATSLICRCSLESSNSTVLSFDAAGTKARNEVFLHSQEEQHRRQRENGCGGENLIPRGDIGSDERCKPNRPNPVACAGNNRASKHELVPAAQESEDAG